MTEEKKEETNESLNKAALDIEAVYKWGIEDIPFNPVALRKVCLLDEGAFHKHADGQMHYKWYETKHFPQNPPESDGTPNYDYFPESRFAEDVAAKRVRYLQVTPEDFVLENMEKYGSDRIDKFIDCQVVDLNGGVKKNPRPSRQSFNESDYFVWMRFTDSKILTVVHMDYNNDYEYVHQFLKVQDKSGDTLYLNGRFDDRIGLYNIIYLYSKFGVQSDFLLTTNEEFGATTANDFSKWVKEDPEREEYCKKYNWAIQHDRNGTDTVLYKYDGPVWRECAKKFTRVGNGTFSCVSALDIGVCAVNWGTGYKSEHTDRHYLHLNDYKEMVLGFLNFYETYKDFRFIFDEVNDPDYNKPKYTYGSAYGYSSAHYRNQNWQYDYDEWGAVPYKTSTKNSHNPPFTSGVALGASDLVKNKNNIYGFDLRKKEVVRLGVSYHSFIVEAPPTSGTDLYQLRMLSDIENSIVWFAERKDIMPANGKVRTKRVEVEVEHLKFYYEDIVAVKDQYFYLLDIEEQGGTLPENMFIVQDWDFSNIVGVVYAISTITPDGIIGSDLLWVAEQELTLLSSSEPNVENNLQIFPEKDIFYLTLPPSLLELDRGFTCEETGEEVLFMDVLPSQTNHKSIEAFLEQNPHKCFCRLCKTFYKQGEMHYGKKGDFCNRCFSHLMANTNFSMNSFKEEVAMAEESGYNQPYYVPNALVYNCKDNWVGTVFSQKKNTPNNYHIRVTVKDLGGRYLSDIVTANALDIRYVNVQSGTQVTFLKDNPQMILGTSLVDSSYPMYILPYVKSDAKKSEHFVEVFIPALGETVTVEFNELQLV